MGVWKLGWKLDPHGSPALLLILSPSHPLTLSPFHPLALVRSPGRKVLRRSLIGARVASYYPEAWFAGDPLLVDVDAERKKAKLQRLSRRGKAPPKKGSGKRSGKK